MQSNLIVPDSEPQLFWRSESVLAVDGARGFGPVVAQFALDAGTIRARTAGIALIAISNANHLGILSPYVEGVAAQGLIGIASSTSEALVHPWGGRDAMIGTNPLAIAVPADPLPFVLDMATGQVSVGRVLHYLELGQPLEPGWAIDALGVPTLDPLSALEGAISPFGGPKGFALGLALEVLISSLTASAMGQDVHGTLDADDVCNKGDLFICINPSVVAPSSDPSDVSRYLAAVRSTRPQPGGPAVRIPGERSASERHLRLSEGVEIGVSIWKTANALLDGDDTVVVDSMSTDVTST